MCVVFVSLSSHFWLILFSPTPALSTISRPLSSSMCSITPETANVGSSYNRMRGPCIGCWFSDRSNCSHWSLILTFTLTSGNLSLYTTLLLLLVLIQLSWLQLMSYTVAGQCYTAFYKMVEVRPSDLFGVKTLPDTIMVKNGTKRARTRI